MAQITWTQNSGYLHSDVVSKKLRESLRPRAKFRQFVDLPPELETTAVSKKGQTFYWDIIQKPTMQNFRIPETDRIQSSDVATVQNSLSVYEMARAIEYTEKAELLTMQEWEGIIENQLAYMASHQFDAEVYQQLKSTPLHVAPTGGTSTTSITLTTNNTTATTNNVALGLGHIKAITDTMKGRNIPINTDRDAYVAIMGIATLRPLKNALEAINQYTESGYSRIIYGEMGRYDDMIFIEQNMMPSGGAVDSTTFDPYSDVSDPWNNALSDWAFFFGDDPVTEAAIVPEEIRAKLPEDYGRDKGAAWYYLGGFGLTRPTAADATVIMWDSAA